MLDNLFSGEQWQTSFWSNTYQQYLMAFIAFIVLLIIFKIFQQIIIARLKKLAEKTETDIDDAAIKVVRSIKPPFYFYLAFWIALNFLAVHEIVQKVINAALIILVTYQVITAVQVLIDHVTQKRIKDKDSQKAVQFLGKFAKGVLWVFGLLLLLSNLGVNVTSLIAGLGIGGIAIALALQNILGDLFSAFAIYFDKPFKVGDFIIVGQEQGTIEKIGVKTTRIRSLSGEQIVIPNTDLTAARIHNYKKMQERRVLLSLGVTYDTPTEKLKVIPKTIEEIISSIDLARFDRAHFKAFGDSALLFEIVYFVKNRDYADYMDVNQEIHLKINEEFANKNLEMAFPTQTIHLQK